MPEFGELDDGRFGLGIKRLSRRHQLTVDSTRGWALVLH